MSRLRNINWGSVLHALIALFAIIALIAAFAALSRHTGEGRDSDARLDASNAITVMDMSLAAHDGKPADGFTGVVCQGADAANAATSQVSVDAGLIVTCHPHVTLMVTRSGDGYRLEATSMTGNKTAYTYDSTKDNELQESAR